MTGLIVALDVATPDEAKRLVEGLFDHVQIFKIGYRLAYRRGGFDFAEWLVKAGKELFLDLKLHDIPNTVEQGVQSIAELGASYLTVHCFVDTMAAAIAARDSSRSKLKLLGVTVLTSYDDDLWRVRETIRIRADQAGQLELDGIVCSAQDISLVRPIFPGLIMTPGIRPNGATHDDQKRVVTPQEACRLGADYIVVGRSIITADDPVAATRAILADMEIG